MDYLAIFCQKVQCLIFYLPLFHDDLPEPFCFFFPLCIVGCDVLSQYLSWAVPEHGFDPFVHKGDVPVHICSHDSIHRALDNAFHLGLDLFQLSRSAADLLF